MKTISLLMAIAILAASALFTGCATKPKPFDYHPGTEIPKGPGIFTGKSGELTYDSDKRAADRGKDGAATDSRAPAGELSPADSEEFRRFQQWQQEKREFEAFQEWKRSPRSAGEYEEFLEWRRWQAFKRWQESQPKTD